ncbi:PREDICTED: receptor-like protein 12 [Theobroma cacao]|uniref:Receptor-like protein 12 n=1 Tax=Theobroma cacao TaxID=3641 RepID=A0AB32WA64_THECC|nr:PREDICTED: receptor-like protein 12 [Theobroma cacao]
MQSIDISQNHNLEGQLPTFPLNSTLKVLSLCGTNFSGKLPESLGNVKFLTKLELSLCNFSRQIPSTITNLRNLVHLNLEFNNFSGLIPSFHRSGVPNLAYLNLQRNRLSGPVHSSIFTLPSLHTLLLGGNQLVGEIDEFPNASCSLMQYLDLNHNYLSGSIPKSIVQLPRLELLSIGYNSFGSMKLDMLSQLKNLRARDLSNAMMLTITDNKAKPKYIGDGYYHDSVTIVNKGNAIFYEKILNVFTCLDLSNNSFHGRIPEEIRDLISLKVLNLSQNSFCGQIPFGLENLKELESLDFSLNKLSGKIPPQLTSLTFLEALNLSYNQLEGIIPQSNQFFTFLNDSYQGNRILCGPPLTRNCDEVGVPLSPPEEDADSLIEGISDWKIVLIGYGCGLVIGLCIGYTVLNEMGNKCLDSFEGNGKRKRKTAR